MGDGSAHVDDKNVSNEGSFINELYLAKACKCPMILLLENAAKHQVMQNGAYWVALPYELRSYTGR